MDEATFDRIAEEELHHLEAALSELDPDECEAELASGVLTVTFADGQKLIVNSHRAAGQIWMAAFRQAWHFSPVSEQSRWVWRTAPRTAPPATAAQGPTTVAVELRATLADVVGRRLGRTIQI
jgi:CyaY protein